MIKKIIGALSSHSLTSRGGFTAWYLLKIVSRIGFSAAFNIHRRLSPCHSKQATDPRGDTEDEGDKPEEIHNIP